MTENARWIDGPIGVLGVGALAEAIVRGLSHGAVAAPDIVLSPRSTDRSHRLNLEFDNVHVATDNQEVLDRADVVLICVRPQDAREAMNGVEFRQDHHVVSVMAGLPLEQLTDLVAPARAIWRSVPNPAVAHRRGVTPLFPGGGVGEHLFAILGGALVVDDESLLHAAGTASATVATFFAFLQTAAGWLTRQGVDEEDATAYLTSLYADVAGSLTGVTDLAKEAAAHATAGGLNERLERSLRKDGFFDDLAAALTQLDAGTRTIG